MGKLKNSVKTKADQTGLTKLGGNSAFVQDPQAELQKIYQANEEYFIERRLDSILGDAMKVLPEEKQAEIENAKLPKKENWQKIAEEFEAEFGEAMADKLAEKIDKIIPPASELYPKEAKYTVMQQAEIDGLRGEIRPEDPEAQEKKELLDRVQEDLTLGSDEMLEHLNYLDRSIMPGVDAVGFTDVKDFLEEYQGGEYASKLPTSHTSLVDFPRYEPDATESGRGGFSLEDAKKLRDLNPGLSPETEKLVLDVTGKMDSMGEEKYRQGQTTLESTLMSGVRRFSAEQQIKNYAFWPLQTDHSKVAEALEKKDYAALREADRQYRETRKTCDEMMALVGENKTPLCGGNVNSTRRYNGRTALPLEYMTDFVTHSKVNGLYLLYGVSKDLKTPMKEILHNPVKVMNKGAEDFLRQEGLQNRPNTGMKLHMAFSAGYPESLKGLWMNTTSGMLLRGFDAVAALEKDPKKRRQIVGTAALAAASASVAIASYRDRWRKLAVLPNEKKDLVYQHAALMPEEEFDPLEAGEKVADPAWKKKIGLRGLVADLRAKGKLDFAQMSERVEKVIRDAEETSDNRYAEDSRFGPKAFTKASQQAFREVIRTATPEEKKDPEFQRFRNKVYARDLKNDPKAAEIMQKLDNSLALQMREKKGWFLSSKDSEEHERMVLANRKHQYKRQLRGEEITDLPPEELKALEKQDVGRMIRSARNATYDYCRIKTEDGKKERFLHDVGAERYRDAKDNLYELDKLADLLETQSPAQGLRTRTRMEFVDNRSDREWARENYQDAAAKLLYGMYLGSKDLSYEEQQKNLTDARVESGVNQIKADPVFQRMIRDVDPEKMMDAIILGDSRVTNAYIQAKDELEHEQDKLEAAEFGLEVLGEADRVQTMTDEEKLQVLSDQSIELQ